MSLQSGSTRSEIIEVVKGRLTLEAEMKGRGERILLRDPTGRSLHQHLLHSNPDSCWHFTSEQASNGALPLDGWVSGREEIAAVAPFIERQVIFSHWER